MGDSEPAAELRFDAPSSADAGEAAVRRERGTHDLVVQTEQFRTELRAKLAGLPFEGDWALAWPTVAAVVCDHVRLDESLLDRSVGGHYFTDTAWNRWLTTLVGLLAHTSHSGSAHLCAKSREW